MKDRIGHIAGQFGRVLEVNGPMTLAALVREVKDDVTFNEMCMAVGWLARDSLVDIDMQRTEITLSLSRPPVMRYSPQDKRG